MSPVPVGSDWTIADLDALPPDEGDQRYEIVDGMLLVTPPPKIPHQIGAFELAKVLEPDLPSDLILIPGPVRVTLGQHTALEPDLSVARRSDVANGELAASPLLVVEVLSPSTRSKDLVLKRDVYARMGIPSYWVLDAKARSLLLLELEGGAYIDVAHLAGDETCDVTRPFPTTIRLPVVDAG